MSDTVALTNLDYLIAHTQLHGPNLGIRAVLLSQPNTKYSKFVDFVHDTIDHSLRNIQDNRMHFQDLGEEGLTSVLTTTFHAYGISAHEKLNNGHCDIVIELHAKHWQWMGEAKIHRDYPYLHKGMNQLFGRYTSGDEHQDHGGLIIYIHNVDAKNVITQWKNYLLEELPCLEELYDSESRSDLSFSSRHSHKSGRPFFVKHIGIMLNHKPDDKKDIRKRK